MKTTKNAKNSHQGKVIHLLIPERGSAGEEWLVLKFFLVLMVCQSFPAEKKITSVILDDSYILVNINTSEKFSTGILHMMGG